MTSKGRILFRALLHREFQVTALTVNHTIISRGELILLSKYIPLDGQAVTCKRLCMETCFAHPMRPDDLPFRDLRLSSQPTEDRPHRDPRPATRSPESGDPKEAGDQGANRQRHVTTKPEFGRAPRGKSPGIRCKSFVWVDWSKKTFSSKKHFSGGCPSCLLYTSPSPRDYAASRMPSSA